MDATPSNERLYYDTLRMIGRDYQTTDQLKRHAGQYGCDYMEELEMAYENLQSAAVRAIYRKRRPLK